MQNLVKTGVDLQKPTVVGLWCTCKTVINCASDWSESSLKKKKKLTKKLGKPISLFVDNWSFSVLFLVDKLQNETAPFGPFIYPFTVICWLLPHIATGNNNAHKSPLSSMQRKNGGTAVKFYHIDFKISRITLGAFLFSPSHVFPSLLSQIFILQNKPPKSHKHVSEHSKDTYMCGENNDLHLFCFIYIHILNF